jgi:hypothetical protein
MSFWNIIGNLAVSDKGETITKVSNSMSVSSTGVTYNTVGHMTYGSDGSSYTQLGSFSTDGSVRMGSSATGLGALFNNRHDDTGLSSLSSRSGLRFGCDDDDEKW